MSNGGERSCCTLARTKIFLVHFTLPVHRNRLCSTFEDNFFSFNGKPTCYTISTILLGQKEIHLETTIYLSQGFHFIKWVTEEKENKCFAQLCIWVGPVLRFKCKLSKGILGFPKIKFNSTAARITCCLMKNIYNQTKQNVLEYFIRSFLLEFSNNSSCGQIGCMATVCKPILQITIVKLLNNSLEGPKIPT